MYSTKIEGDKIIYNDDVENVDISLPRKNYLDFIEILEPNKLSFPVDYRNAIDKTIKSGKLRNLAKGSKKISIIVSDATRGVPTAKVLPFVIEELEKAGVKKEQITIVVALGVHRPATKLEMKKIIGEEFENKIKIVNHNGFDNEGLVKIGETSFGTPVEVNKFVYESDFRIIIGKVEPHEFAGFSGGRKSVLPGISSERAIEYNHRPEMLLKNNARPGIMKDNPVNDDMVESAKILGIDFCVNIVQNSNAEIVGMFAGDLIKSHKKSVEFLKSAYKVELNERPDIVLTTPGKPLNIDFYQSIKSIIAAASIVKDNGVIVMYSECVEGVNSVDMLKPYEGSKNLENVIDYLINNYKIQMDHALLLGKIMQKDIKIIVYSPNIKREILKKMFIEPAEDPQSALDLAIKIADKKEPKVLIFPQPQRTLPVVCK